MPFFTTVKKKGSLRHATALDASHNVLEDAKTRLTNKKIKTLRKLISNLTRASQPLTPAQAKWRMVRDFFALIFIASALLFAVYLIVATERAQEREAEKRRALEHMSSMRASIEQRIQANVLVLRALKPEILWQDTPDRMRLQKIIDEFLDTDLDISHLALAPDLRISFIYPLAGNEKLLGVDYRAVKAQYHEILQAIGSRDIILSSPVDLLQGVPRSLRACRFFRPTVVFGELPRWSLTTNTYLTR